MYGEIQKKLIRFTTCSPFRAHIGPLYFVNKILKVCDIDDYIIGTFMYEYLHENIPELFRNSFQRNADVHDHNLRNANDLHMPYGQLDNRKFSIKFAGANLWNSLPSFVKNSQWTHIFKKSITHYLVERKGYTWRFRWLIVHQWRTYVPENWVNISLGSDLSHTEHLAWTSADWFHWLIVNRWPLCVPVNCVSIGSGSGLSPIWCRDTVRTSTDLLKLDHRV